MLKNSKLFLNILLSIASNFINLLALNFKILNSRQYKLANFFNSLASIHNSPLLILQFLILFGHFFLKFLFLIQLLAKPFPFQNLLLFQLNIENNIRFGQSSITIETPVEIQALCGRIRHTGIHVSVEDHVGA
jgi:hypothetical protein